MDTLAQQIRQLIPLLGNAEQANTALALLKQRLDAIDVDGVDQNDLTKFELRLTESLSKRDARVEKDFAEMRKKLLLLAILEKIVIAVTIYYMTKGV
jgi:hypothetical protein